MSSRRSSLPWLTLGVALPAALLAGGWAMASVRQREASAEAERARAGRALDAAREAVTGGLEAIRAREDERPFYHYNYYYSPPEVLAISDPVAVSPLAELPADPRVVGWLQIEPDGSVRTPLAPTPVDGEAVEVARAPETEAREARLSALAADPIFDELRALVRGGAAALVVRSRPTEPEDEAPIARARPRRRVAAPAVEPPRPARVTVEQNVVDNRLAQEILRAQSGDSEALDRLTQRGRAAPLPRRQDVSRAALLPSGEEPAAPEPTPSQAAPDPAPAPPRRPRRRATAPEPPRPPPEPRAPVSLAPIEVEVDYTPMEWRAAADFVALERVVSHEGARVGQAVVLDREALEAWVDETLARFAPGTSGELRRAGPELECAHEASIAPLEARLCVPASALAGSERELGRTLGVQLALSALLVLLVALASVAVHRAARRERELGEARAGFISAVSHELRTPLTTLRLHAEMLAEGLVPEARVPKVYDELARETLRLSHLVDNVLEAASLDAGRRQIEPVRLDVTARVRAIGERARPLAVARGFALELPPAEPSIEASVDPEALDRMVFNLIDNALKYGALEGEEAKREVRIELEASERGLRLAVSDRGPGIASDERERVFERFHRAAGADGERPVGTGLGLALVRELARAHGGDATALARPGGGAMIEVTFPARGDLGAGP